MNISKRSLLLFGIAMWIIVFGTAICLVTLQTPLHAQEVKSKEKSNAKTSSRKDARKEPEKQNTEKSKTEESTMIPDPKVVGGEPEGIVQVANLVYGGVKSSECFSDHFLIKAEKETAISTSRRFHAVKLSSTDIYNFPLLIMTGEGEFELPDTERQNLKTFVERGGFLLASAGCSSVEWNRSFRKEMAVIFPDNTMDDLGMDHPVFHTVYDIDELVTKHGTPKPVSGISHKGRLGVLYSQDGLNDTSHTQGCCCCGGNEIYNAVKINVNILAYALTH